MRLLGQHNILLAGDLGPKLSKASVIKPLPTVNMRPAKCIQGLGCPKTTDDTPRDHHDATWHTLSF